MLPAFAFDRKRTNEFEFGNLGGGAAEPDGNAKKKENQRCQITIPLVNILARPPSAVLSSAGCAGATCSVSRRPPISSLSRPAASP